MRVLWLGLLAVSAAHAGTKPLYQPAPAWVVPAALPKSEAARLIVDQQQRLADGQVWAYIDIANRVTSQQSLLENGTISLDWQPDEGDLIIHRVAIIRDGETIDLTAGDPLTILRRERKLESLELDGVLTATMPAKGLQVGDILRITYSITRSDPVLKGQMQSSAVLLADQTDVGFARVRALWPAAADVHWRAMAKVKSATLGRAGADRELIVATPLPKQPDIPDDAPARFRSLPIVELSTFADWTAVAKTMAPLFVPVAFAPGSPLAAEAARIRAAAPDPLTRAELALESVQGNVRYLFNGLDHGNYVPQSPDKTWTIRSGDCKAKTLLLLSLLRALDIAAEPVLANTKTGDHLPAMLPSASVFNHILVMATIGGQTYWLDGTSLGARLVDIGNTPNLRHVLPLRPEGATLLAVATHADARPELTVDIDIDASGGIGLVAPAKVAMIFRGPTAEQVKTANGKFSLEQRKKFVDGVLQVIDKLLGDEKLEMLPVTRTIDVDAADSTATVRVTGLISGEWTRSDQRYELTIDPAVGHLEFGGERGRPEWRTIPVATPSVESGVLKVAVHLPDGGKGFTLDGDRTLPPALAGRHTMRTVTETAGTVTVTDRVDSTAAEVAPADIAATRAALALAKSRRLKIKAPETYPAYWQVVRAARTSGKIQAIEAAYAAAIADAIEKPPLIEKRAAFRSDVYDRAGAVADLTTVIAERPTADILSRRAALYHQLRRDPADLVDMKAAYALEPGDDDTIRNYAWALSYVGRGKEAEALLDDAAAGGGERRAGMLRTKAMLLVRDHQTDGAIAAIDAAIKTKPTDAQLIHDRCWIKAMLGVELDTALKDCTKAMELGVEGGEALDSRALAFFKLGRLDDAMTDLDAALAERPSQSNSLFLRAVIEAKRGKTAAASDDLTGARLIWPPIIDDYKLYGVAAPAL